MARRVLRDMADVSGLGIVSEICEDCFCTDAKRCIALSDYVLDGMLGVDDLVEEILGLLSKC